MNDPLEVGDLVAGQDEVVAGHRVKNLDVLQLTNPTFRKLYSEAYLEFVNKAPHVLGMFYDLLNQRRTKSTGEHLRAAFQQLNLLKLELDAARPVGLTRHSRRR